MQFHLVKQKVILKIKKSQVNFSIQISVIKKYTKIKILLNLN